MKEDYNTYAYKWFYLAILSLGLGGGFAFIVAMSRTPFGYKYFPADYMYHALAGHVVLAILLWLLSSTVVLWYYYLGGRGWKSSYILSLTGILLIAVSALRGKGMAVPNNYVPTIVDTLFFSGLILFFTGFTVNILACIRKALKHINSSHVIFNALSISVIVAAGMVLALAYSFYTYVQPDEPFRYYERLFWTGGHIQQVLNATLLITVWYTLLQKLDVEIRSWKILKYTNLLLLLSTLVLFVFQIFFDPLSSISRGVAEMTYMIGIGIPLFFHIGNILRQIKVNKWSVGYISLIFSISIYVAGVLIAYSGFGNDLRVPAHYHGAVTSLTLGLMGLSYYLVREWKRRVAGERIARIQPVVYGVGMLLFITGLFISGTFGAPRKTYGIAFTTDPAVLIALTVMGIGTVLAVSGGVMFVTYISLSLLYDRFHKKDLFTSIEKRILKNAEMGD